MLAIERCFGHLATVFFAAAVMHTFCVKRFAHWARRCSSGSMGEGMLNFLAETEVVFGLWVAALFLGITVIEGSLHQAVAYIESLNFKEPVFVVIIMVIAATVIDRRRSALILAHQVRKFAAIGEEQPASRFISRFAHGAKRRPT